MVSVCVVGEGVGLREKALGEEGGTGIRANQVRSEGKVFFHCFGRHVRWR